MATDVKIDAAVWDKLTSEDKVRIENIMNAVELVKGGVHFVPAANSPEIHWPKPPNRCKLKCHAAEAAAVVACNAISDGVLFAACSVAAHEAGEECLRHC